MDFNSSDKKRPEKTPTNRIVGELKGDEGLASPALPRKYYPSNIFDGRRALREKPKQLFDGRFFLFCISRKKRHAFKTPSKMEELRQRAFERVSPLAKRRFLATLQSQTPEVSRVYAYRYSCYNNIFRV
jgi:hypothetical protein